MGCVLWGAGASSGVLGSWGLGGVLGAGCLAGLARGTVAPVGAGSGAPRGGPAAAACGALGGFRGGGRGLLAWWLCCCWVGLGAGHRFFCGAGRGASALRGVGACLVFRCRVSVVGRGACRGCVVRGGRGWSRLWPGFVCVWCGLVAGVGGPSGVPPGRGVASLCWGGCRWRVVRCIVRGSGVEGCSVFGGGGGTGRGRRGRPPLGGLWAVRGRSGVGRAAFAPGAAGVVGSRLLLSFCCLCRLLAAGAALLLWLSGVRRVGLLCPLLCLAAVFAVVGGGGVVSLCFWVGESAWGLGWCRRFVRVGLPVLFLLGLLGPPHAGGALPGGFLFGGLACLLGGQAC